MGCAPSRPLTALYADAEAATPAARSGCLAPLDVAHLQWLLVPGVHFCVGFGNTVISTALKMVIVNELQVNPATQQALFGMFGSLPWNFKIAFAFLSDCVPIGGRRRVPYLIAGVLLQITALLMLGLPGTPTLAIVGAANSLSTLAQVLIGV